MRGSCYAVLSLILLMLPDVSAGQEPTEQLLRQMPQHERIVGPVLEVREFSGEFERWGRAITISTPNVELFRWSTNSSRITSATWSILDGPPDSGASIVGSGSAGPAPDSGSVRVFRIDFRKFFPSGPPAGGRSYRVILEPVDAQGQAGPTSMPVQVRYGARLDLAAFAGREGDIVAQKQMSLAKASKLAFLQALARKHVDLVANVAQGDVPDTTVRLTPRGPVVEVEGSAMPHVLGYRRSSDVRPATCQVAWVEGCFGEADFPQSGEVRMGLRMEPGHLYLLDMSIKNVAGLPFELNSLCRIDGLQQNKIFPAPEQSDWAHLLAVIEMPPSHWNDQYCSVSLSQASSTTGDGSVTWTFYSAELTRLPNQ
jgi:hypothetical protein